MTLGSLLWFAMVWLKYEVTPEPLRYFWWVVWSKVRVAAHAIHRRLVVQGDCMRHCCYLVDTGLRELLDASRCLKFVCQP